MISRSLRAVSIRAMWVTAAMFLWWGWLAAPAQATTEAHIFDPTLSLTGWCETDEADEVKDPWCPGPPGPSAPFHLPNITVDSSGDMYVSSHQEEVPEGRVDIFSPEGKFITEIPVVAPRNVAVDAQGNLYIFEYYVGGPKQISRFSPTVYKPGAEEIVYSTSGTVVVEEFTEGYGSLAGWTGIAVNPSSERLFVSSGLTVGEWSSAEEGNKFLDGTIGQGILTNRSKYLAVDVSRKRLFVTDSGPGSDTSFIRVLELESPHKSLGVITGADTPNTKFLGDTGYLTVDIDEKTGHIFVSDLSGTNKVYEFGSGLRNGKEGEEEEYLATYQHKFSNTAPAPGEVAVDNSLVSPNRGTLYVSSRGTTVDHTYAFRYAEEETEEPPAVESVLVSGVTESEAVLRATINPGGLETSYRLEYTTQEAFEAEGFEGGILAEEGVLPAGTVGKSVSAPLNTLVPGTLYRFRVVASNKAGEDKEETHFHTYPSLALEPCANDALRTAFSARLPDCRAYELVTPPDTNGRVPVGIGGAGIYFPTLESSPSGSKMTFRIEGGSLPGSEGAGAFNGENYLSRRKVDGWSTEIAAPSGSEEATPVPGGVSPDQEYSFWGGQIEDEPASLAPHIRYPDGHSDLVGRGSLGTESKVNAALISENGSHVIFATVNGTKHPAVQLEENAPPEGTAAVYDRTGDEVTHVVSLLPGNGTPKAGEDAIYVGASYDGTGIAFRIGEVLYLRYHEEQTYEIGTGVTYAGIAEGGGRIFYLQGGDLFAFDVASEEVIPFSESGDVTPVNVSMNGSAAYLLSPSVLTEEPNPNGAVAQMGKENLYLSREGQMSFVGRVEPSDVAGKPLGNGEVAGLGQWTKAFVTGKVGDATSRTTPDGSVLLFQASSPLTGYDPEGHTEIYRYDSVGGTLECLSCNPTEMLASSNASLQTIALTSVEAPVDARGRIPNLRSDGKRAFFQSPEPLVPSDVDGVQDVYEWEAQGVGSCKREGGCIYLISSGHSSRDNHLYSVSESGNDVFFQTSDLLLGLDGDSTPSIYDARVNGGFPETQPTPCQGEGCRPAPEQPPGFSMPSTPPLGSKGNVQERKCPKGKRRVTRDGKTQCVRKHRKRHRIASKKRRAGK